MSFSKSTPGNERAFSNADSFAMAFDKAWESYQNKKNEVSLEKDEKLKNVLEAIKDHPFLNESPEMAKEVAKFRIRLLNLN